MDQNSCENSNIKSSLHHYMRGDRAWVSTPKCVKSQGTIWIKWSIIEEETGQ